MSFNIPRSPSIKVPSPPPVNVPGNVPSPPPVNVPGNVPSPPTGNVPGISTGNVPGISTGNVPGISTGNVPGNIPGLPSGDIPRNISSEIGGTNKTEVENKLKVLINKQIASILDIFNNYTKVINNAINNYNTNKIIDQGYDDIYSQYEDTNNQYIKNIQKSSNNIGIDKRKTFYQDQTLEELRILYQRYSTIYVALLILVMVFIFIKFRNRSKTEQRTIIFVFVAFVLYPYYIHYVVKYIIRITKSLGDIFNSINV